MLNVGHRLLPADPTDRSIVAERLSKDFALLVAFPPMSGIATLRQGPMEAAGIMQN